MTRTRSLARHRRLSPLNDTTFSVLEITIDATPKIISGPETLIFIPRTIIGETPAIISGSKILISVSQILISGRPVESKNQQVADLPHGDTYLRRGNKYRKDATYPTIAKSEPVI